METNVSEKHSMRQQKFLRVSDSMMVNEPGYKSAQTHFPAEITQDLRSQHCSITEALKLLLWDALTSDCSV